MLTFLKCVCCCFYCCCRNQVLPRFSCCCYNTGAIIFCSCIFDFPETNSRRLWSNSWKWAGLRLQKVPRRFWSHHLTTIHLLDHVSGFPCHQLQESGGVWTWGHVTAELVSWVGSTNVGGESAFSALLIVRAFFCLSEHVEPRGHNAKGLLRLRRGLTLRSEHIF